MNTDAVKYLNQSRTFIFEQIKNLTVQQLNKIPAGFNNNIIWQLGHLIWAQQNDCYIRSGTQIVVDDKYFSPFQSGTKPSSFIDEAEITVIKQLLISTIGQMALDIESETIVTNDAILGTCFHDWLHAGYITALKRLV
jgi:hypothetical protein